MKTVSATTLAAAAAASTFGRATNSTATTTTSCGGGIPGIQMGNPNPTSKTTMIATTKMTTLLEQSLSENSSPCLPPIMDVGLQRQFICSLPRGGAGGEEDENDKDYDGKDKKEETESNEEKSHSKQHQQKKRSKTTKKKKQHTPNDDVVEEQQQKKKQHPTKDDNNFDDEIDDADNSSQKNPKKESKNHSTSTKNSTSSSKPHKKSSTSSSSSSTTKDSSSSTRKNHPSSNSNKIVEDILTHEDYYHVLGLDKGSASSMTQGQITKAYRKRAVQTHPDKTGGDRRAFDKVAEAYDILSDDTKKQLYDQYGKAGLEQQGGFGGGGFGGMPSSYQNVFRSMFQQQQQQQRERQQPKNRTMRYQLQVTLEELYQGTTQTVRVTSPPDQSRMFRHPQQQQPSQPPPKDVQIHIPKGSISGESIRMSGEMDFIQDATPGDLIFILTQIPHETFTRKGHDLAMELVITLEEAICGVHRTIQHLDGRPILLHSAQHHQSSSAKPSSSPSSKDVTTTTGGTPIMIQTGDVQVLKGQGMPKRHYRHHHRHHGAINDDDDDDDNNLKFGDLYVQYRVELPKASKKAEQSLTEMERKELGRLLRKLQGTKQKSNMDDDDGKNIQYLKPALSTDFGRASGPVIMEEEDHHHHHPGDEEEEEFGFQNPFGGGTRFSSSSYFFGSNPFGGDGGPHPDDGGSSNVQCQQM